MKSPTAFAALAALVLACTACSGSGDAGGASGGGVSEADCHAVIAKGYALQNITGPEFDKLVDEQSKACGQHNSLTAQDVSCVAQASDFTQFGACNLGSKTLH
jgi:hypothetical protein